MSITVHAQVKGGEELATRMKFLLMDVDKTLDDALIAGAEVLKSAAESRAPVSNCIIVEKAESGLGAQGSVTYEIGLNKDYWKYKFFETGATAHEIRGNPLLIFSADNGDLVVTPMVQHLGMAARPFLRPAVDSDGDKAIEAVKAKINEIIESSITRPGSK